MYRPMTDESMHKIAVWAAEAATRAAQLPSRQAREAFLLQFRQELVTGAREQGMSEENAGVFAETCVAAARRILAELLARGMSFPGGRA